MKKKKTLPGINIQYPISRLILEGKKTIETRTYPIPNHYIGKEMVIIETPGKDRKFTARIIGTIVFGESFEYKDKKSFYNDTSKHCVTPDSPWKWIAGASKWGWPVIRKIAFSKERPAPKKRGIKFVKNVHL